MKKAKEFILGALVGSMVMGGCVTAFGSNGTKTIQAVYKNIKVIIDGKELKTDKEPFTYEGTTYLPVRAVAEAVGKEVKWDSATQTVILGASAKLSQDEATNTQKETETKQGEVVLGSGKYIAGKDIAVGTYALTGALGTGVVSGVPFKDYGFAVIITDDKDFHYPSIDTYYVLEPLVLKDGDEIEIDKDVKVKFVLK